MVSCNFCLGPLFQLSDKEMERKTGGALLRVDDASPPPKQNCWGSPKYAVAKDKIGIVNQKTL